VGAYSCTQLQLGDCTVLMDALPEGSVGAIVCDPPYGLEFMALDWEKLGDKVPKSIRNFKGFKEGDGALRLPKYSSTSRYSTPNRTCSVCGGMERGTRRKCPCERPHDHWKPIGKRRKLPEDTPDGVTGGGMQDHLLAIGLWHTLWLKSALRVLQPGGIAKIFSGTRTFHRLAWAMGEAGFEILRIDAWTYGSGWPKSLDVGRSMRKRLGLPDDSPVLCDGYGTALKSCWEPFLVGRKALV